MHEVNEKIVPGLKRIFLMRLFAYIFLNHAGLKPLLLPQIMYLPCLVCANCVTLVSLLRVENICCCCYMTYINVAYFL